MMKTILSFLILTLSLIGLFLIISSKGRNVHVVEKSDPTIRERFTNINPALHLIKDFRYKTNNDEYDIALFETEYIHDDEETLSTKISALYTKTDSTGNTAIINKIVDFVGEEDSGMCFWTKRCEFTDIDGDGHIDPILVYRIYKAAYDENEDVYESFSGRIKIIIFHNNEKAVIRAISGTLDDERSTTANSAYFNLPMTIRKHVVKKMETMYTQHDYGFDNSNDFAPRREKGAPK